MHAQTEIRASGVVGDIQVRIYPTTVLTPEIEQAAAESVKQTRWNPTLKNGQPVAATVDIPLLFGMELPAFYDNPPRPNGGFAAIQQHVVYPQEAKDAGVEGTVIVQAFITEYGKASDLAPKICTSS